jgi:hypothetical protein
MPPVAPNVSVRIYTYDPVCLRAAISKVDHVPAQRIDPLGPLPPYLQIAAIIKHGILSGQGLVYTVQARGTYVARLDGATR